MLVETRAEDTSAPGDADSPGASRSTQPRASSAPWAIWVIVAVAAALRFAGVGSVSGDEFYDAAVRSMGMSLHNFFYGAFDPAGVLSIDKPPLDLWLQVLSVKVFGWSSFALKLPEALSGTLAVPLLYDVVRRVLGRPTGLAAAAALATLPESVLTSRSDTMDSVMMLFVVAALWLTVRAAQSGRRRPLVLAGVALGLAFNVKLLQALIPLPALALLYLLAAQSPLRRKLLDLSLAGAALIGVGLAWAVAVSLAPGHHPWAIGSSDGSIWNAMFVFNGLGKLAGASASHKPGGPGIFRLLVSTGWHYDLLFGCVLFSAVAVAVAGALVSLRGRADGGRVVRVPRAFVIALATWTVVAVLVFDTMSTVHARYLEALAPALAALLGYGATSLAGFAPAGGSPRAPWMLGIVAALVVSCAYTLGLRAPIAWGAAALILATAGAGLLTRAGGRVHPGGPLEATGRWLTAGLIMATLLAFPAHESFQLVRSSANDSLGLATAPAGDVKQLSSYLRPRTRGVRYEVAIDEPLSLAPLIIDDQRPILPLTSFGGRILTRLAGLQAAVAAGRVRYGLVGSYHCTRATMRWAACGPAARWIRSHGRDVTAAAGLSGRARLYVLAPG